MGDTCRGCRLPAAESQGLPRHIHPPSAHSVLPPPSSGAGRGPNKQDGIQIEGVRKSVCGVKHKQARGPARAGQLTLSDCGKCRLVLFFIRALSGALGFQRSVDAKARLQNENCMCACVFFFLLLFFFETLSL